MSRHWNTAYNERESTRKGQENEAMSWRGIALSSCMLRKLFGTQKVGWWMVNSLRKVGYTQMHPSCHMNYSSPTVCTGFGKQQKDFKAGLKDEWMSTWIKRVGKMNYKKIQWVANTNTAFSLQNEGQWRKRNLLFQCPMLFIVSLAYN